MYYRVIHIQITMKEKIWEILGSLLLVWFLMTQVQIKFYKMIFWAVQKFKATFFSEIPQC
jgi:hypothetical protein